jgi:hypothetical protein
MSGTGTFAGDPVPEPASLGLAAVGGLGLIVSTQRRKRAAFA